MRLKAPPFELLEELFGEAGLARSRQPHRVIPRSGAPVSAVRRFAVRLFAPIDLPNAVGAVSVPRGSAQQTAPDKESLHVVKARSNDAFVAHFGIDDGHRRSKLDGFSQALDGVWNARAVGMACLQHFEIEHFGIFDLGP
jgi:hypothetical protein